MDTSRPRMASTGICMLLAAAVIMTMVSCSNALTDPLPLFGDLEDFTSTPASVDTVLPADVTTASNPGDNPRAAVAKLHTSALKSAPDALQLQLPGLGPIVAKRRPDIDTNITVNEAAAAPSIPVIGAASVSGSDSESKPSPPSLWVGDVEGYPAGLSVVALVVSELDNSTYGMIRFVDTEQRKVTLYNIKPHMMKGADGTLVKDPTKHLIYEAEEPSLPRTFRTRRNPPRGRREGPTDAKAAISADPAHEDVAVVPDTATAADPATATGQDTAELAGTAAAVEDVAAAVPLEGKRRRLHQTTSVRQDLLIVYTAAAAAAAGGDEAIINQARISVAMTNKAYVDSGVPNLQLTLLDVRRADNYNEAGRDALADLADNKIPNVHTWRQQLGADLVSVFNNNGGVCGVAYMCPGVQNGCNSWSAIMNGCWQGYVLAHELGHSQGCGHNVEDGRSIFEWNSAAFGYRRCVSGSGQNFKTIMSYGCPNNAFAPEVGRFSNPNIVINGVRIGHTADGDCARTLRETATRVAGWTTRPTGVTPLAPVQVFEHCSMGGRSFSLAAGRYSTLPANIPNDAISSVRVSPGFRVVLWEHGGFTGRKVVLGSGSTICLVAQSFNDLTSSIEVLPDTAPPVQLYSDCNYGGVPATLVGAGRYDGWSMNIWNDALSSVKVATGYRVTLYEHGGFSGRSLVLNAGSYACLTTFNDMTSSILVEAV